MLTSRSSIHVFFALLRILAWKHVYHTEDISELGPKYNCSRCDLPEKEFKGNIDLNCPRCPFAEAERSFKAEVEEEIKARFGGFGEWSFEKLLEVFNSASRMLKDNGKRISPKWDATIAGICRIVQSEKEQARYIGLWNRRQSR